jgi:Mrp family chromosome partitioning ATPase
MLSARRSLRSFSGSSFWLNRSTPLQSCRLEQSRTSQTVGKASNNYYGTTCDASCWSSPNKSGIYLPSEPQRRVSEMRQVERRFFSGTGSGTNSITKDVSKSKLSPRRQAQFEEEILAAANVLDPLVGKPIRTLGWLKRVSFGNGVDVTVQLRIPSLALHSESDKLRQLIVDAVHKEKHDTWSELLQTGEEGMTVDVEFVSVSSPPCIPQQQHIYHSVMSISDDDDEKDTLSPGLASTTHIVPVYSCKGGVGKSTISLNLAYAMAHRGIKVGLLDVDVFGPSLPTLVKLDPDAAAVRKSPLGTGMVYPITHRGVKLLSLGFVSGKSGVPGAGQSHETDDGSSGAAIMRGPMASRVVSQLVKGTDWGDLDVLLLDLPPGTGDVQLTICQDFDQLSGAVGVTTPSKLAMVDARKGIQMFEALNIPTLAVVENMSYFEVRTMSADDAVDFRGTLSFLELTSLTPFLPALLRHNVVRSRNTIPSIWKSNGDRR